jgi:hypothetical protein
VAREAYPINQDSLDATRAGSHHEMLKVVDFLIKKESKVE